MHAFRSLALGLALLTGTAIAAAPDPEVLDRGSDIAYRRALQPAANDRRLNADAMATSRARRIANRLVLSAGAIDPQSKRYAWAVNLVPGAAPDAQVYPGGRVIVTEALVGKAGLGDDEVGAILAHAFAHSLLGHETRRVATIVAERDASADPNRRALDVADATTEVIRTLRYTPEEIESADRLSVEMLARAAYDPRAAGSAWRRLALGDKGMVARSPASESRLGTLDATIRAAVPLYDETRAKSEAAARQERPPRISGPTKAGPAVR